LGGQLPAFLAEYLVAAYGIAEASRLVAEHWPTARSVHRLKYRLLEEGSVDLLDHLEAVVNLDEGRTLGRLTAFQYTCPISSEILDQWPELFSGGLWGRVRLATRTKTMHPQWPISTDGELDEANEVLDDVHGPMVVDFDPCQVSVDVKSFILARSAFSSEEWIDLLLASAGYNPAWIRAQPRGHRLTRLYLLRLISMVERNLNLIELGPKNTGKSHLLRNLSPYAYTVAGGQATPANLFVNLNTQAAGLIQSRRVIVFDEVARIEFSRNQATLSLLKDYMESGQFSRGRSSYGADTSLVFMGNIDVEGQRPAARYRHLLQVLPAALQDTALIDRLHAFIPGWEFPKLTPEALAVNWALASDYFGEVLLALRDWPYDVTWSHVRKRWPWRSGMTRRDVVAVDRIGQALFKLVFPDSIVDEDVAVELLSLAAEGRQRIHEQLVKMAPGEFLSYPVGFEGIPSHTDDSWIVETAQDRVLNRHPRSGEATGVAGGVQSADAVVVQAVLGGERTPRPVVMTSDGLIGVEASWQVARFYLDAHRAQLGLESRIRWDALGIQFSGGPGDVRGRVELAIVLALVSAWINEPLAPAVAAVGGLTLTGDVTAPPEMLALVMAVLNRGRRTILVPATSPVPLLQDTFGPRFPSMRLVPVTSVEELLRWAFRK
jgi:ATP-dependent Lon protease